jgi:hypothetical protein
MTSATPSFDWILRNPGIEIETFYGPRCQYNRAIDELVNDRTKLGTEEIPITVDEFCSLSEDSRIEQFARMRIANGFSAPALNELMRCSADRILSDDDLCAKDGEPGWYSKAKSELERFGLKLGKTWSMENWRTLSFVMDGLNQSDNRLEGTAIERTPLFLAGPDSGRVLYLVVERIPGPPIITPHWWRLGLVPLGKHDQLLHAIHRGIQAVLSARSSRFHVRWWLDVYPGGGGWHDDINDKDNNSAQVAAACATLALCEPQQTESILDTKVGVSGKLPDGELTRHLLTVELEDVTHEAMKSQTAKKAGLHCIVFAPQSAERAKAAIEESDDFSIHGAPTLGEAFESLRLTSSDIRRVKTHTLQCWRNAYLETDTEDLYVQLSEKKD